MEEIMLDGVKHRVKILKGTKTDDLAKWAITGLATIAVGKLVEKAYDTLIIEGKLKELLRRGK